MGSRSFVVVAGPMTSLSDIEEHVLCKQSFGRSFFSLASSGCYLDAIMHKVGGAETSRSVIGVKFVVPESTIVVLLTSLADLVDFLRCEFERKAS